MLSRRELLRHLGSATAAAATVNAVGLAACGSPVSKATSIEAPAVDASLRTFLAEVIAELERRYPIATVLASRRRVVTSGRDNLSASVSTRTVSTLLFQIFDGASWRAVSTRDLSRGGAASLAKTLLEARVPIAEKGGATKSATPIDLDVRGDSRVAAVTAAQWLARTDDLYKRAEGIGTSRTIYRGVAVTAESVEDLFIGAGSNVRQSIHRLTAGATFVARLGSGLAAEGVRVGATGGAELATLTDEALESTSRGSLALIGGVPAPETDIDLVLAPSVVQVVAGAIANALLDASQWVSGRSAWTGLVGDQVADRQFSLTDNPVLPGGYASYDVDAEGAKASERPLIREGIVIGPFTDRLSSAVLNIARTGHGRLGVDDITRASFSNLRVAPGQDKDDDLIAQVKKGYLIESAAEIATDPSSRQLVLNVKRAHEIEAGTLSGRIVGPAVVRADLLGLLLAIRGVSSTTESTALADPIARSIEAPSILTRAEIL